MEDDERRRLFHALDHDDNDDADDSDDSSTLALSLLLKGAAATAARGMALSNRDLDAAALGSPMDGRRAVLATLILDSNEEGKKVGGKKNEGEGDSSHKTTNLLSFPLPRAKEKTKFFSFFRFFTPAPRPRCSCAVAPPAVGWRPAARTTCPTAGASAGPCCRRRGRRTRRPR